MNKHACFSTGTYSYIPFIRVLSESFLKMNPGFDFYYFVIEPEIPFLNKTDFIENVHIINIFDLGIPNLKQFLLKYDLLEVSTGVKPFAVDYLFNKCEYELAIFLDADIEVFDSFDKVVEELAVGSQIVLTPHMITPYPKDNKGQTMLDISKAGVWNMGFAGFYNNTDCQMFINFWKDRLSEQCYLDHSQGMHVDQKWMEFAPAFSEHVHILRDPGFNVSYWNLHERFVQKIKGEWKTGYKFIDRYRGIAFPLVFYHFSGIDFNNLERLSRHQNRYKLSDFAPDVQELFAGYAKKIKKAGLDEFKKYKYTFDTIKYKGHNIPITKAIRNVYRECLKHGHDLQGANLVEHLEMENQGILSVLEEALQDHINFPIKTNSDLKSFFNYLIDNATRDFHINLSTRHKTMVEKKKDTFFKKIPEGINLFGYLEGEFGVGNIPKYNIKMLQQFDMPHVLSTFWYHVKSRETYNWKYQDESPYLFNLYYVNADTTCSVKSGLPPHRYVGNYEIGVWFWEIEAFPPYWLGVFKELNELWLYSKFIYNSIKEVSPIPCMYLPFPYESTIKEVPPYRADDAFTYLFVYDFFSDFYRKNPLGIIDAFREAFPDHLSENPTNVRLIIKSINGDKCQPHLDKLITRSASDKRIQIIDEHYTKEQMQDLYRQSHVFVSIHRAEGLGLTIMDAIDWYRPVIMTEYGGNTDLVPEDYPYYVKWLPAPVETDNKIYNVPGAFWAEPDISHTAFLMQEIRKEYPEAVQYMKIFAKPFMLEHHNPRRTFDIIYNRMRFLLKTGIAQLRVDEKPVKLTEGLGTKLFKLLVGQEKTLVFKTARKPRVERILAEIKRNLLTMKVHVFGEFEEDWPVKYVDHYFVYTKKDRYEYYSLDRIDKDVLKGLKAEEYHTVIVPFAVNDGTQYRNIWEIIRQLKPHRIFAVGIDDVIYDVNGESEEMTALVK